jgi:hypothetical protein
VEDIDADVAPPTRFGRRCFLAGSNLKAATRPCQGHWRRTEDTLKEIREATGETPRIVQDVKDNIDYRIIKIIDRRMQSDQAKYASSTAITKMLMEGLMKRIGQQTPDEGEK